MKKILPEHACLFRENEMFRRIFCFDSKKLKAKHIKKVIT